MICKMRLYLHILVAFCLLHSAPVSDSGADQVVELGESVQLDGTNSYDQSGGVISTYTWSHSNLGVSLSSEASVSPTFTAPNEIDTLLFRLTVENDSGEMSSEFSATDLFISEYHDGSGVNQYIEIYNGTENDVNLSEYELWILKSVSSGMTWNPVYDEEEEEWSTDFWVLLFNSDTSKTNINTHQSVDGDIMQRVDVQDLKSGETLMIIREGEGEDFSFVGRNFAVWDRLVKISGDEPVALLKSGAIIDQIGDDEDVGSNGWEVGEDGTTKEHTLIRKGTVISGNTDWTSSSASEWDVFEKDTFEDIFSHECTSCDDEVIVYVSESPTAVASYVSTDLLDLSGDICDTIVTLDGSASITVTGDISYQWTDGNGLLDEEDLTKAKPNFSTIAQSGNQIPAGSYEFSLVVFDGLLYSSSSTVSVSISDNLCPHASASVAVPEGEQWTNRYPSILYFEYEEFEDIGNGIWEEGEDFYDVGNFVYDEGESFTDLNGSGEWEYAYCSDGTSTSEIDCCCDNSGIWSEYYLACISPDSFEPIFDDDDQTSLTWPDCVVDDNCFENDLVDYWTQIISAEGQDYCAEMEIVEESLDPSTVLYFPASQTSIDVHWHVVDEPFTDAGNGVYDPSEQFTDIGNGEYDDGEFFVDVNDNGLWDDDQIVYLSALSSNDPTNSGEIMSYQWDVLGVAPGGIEYCDNRAYISQELCEASGGDWTSGDAIYSEVELTNTAATLLEGSVVSFIRPTVTNAQGDTIKLFSLDFTLVANDGAMDSKKDTLSVKFGLPTPPLVPFLSPRVEHEAIILSWDNSAEDSEDYLTGYFDFEGYKLYKSIDGGQTWGGESSKIYDSNGSFAGWKPIMQWDYTELEDNSICNFSSDFCIEGNRGVDVSGYDPHSYWINIGDNDGITHSFIDTNVVDGVEYTYALTSYDTGVWTQYVDPSTSDTLWFTSNPGNYKSTAMGNWITWDGINLITNGFATMESPIDSISGKNFVTLKPGYYAANISFPSESEINSIFTADTSNWSNGLIQYEIVNLDDLEPKQVAFQIQAGEGDANSFEGLSTVDPLLYAYYLGENEPLVGIAYSGLLNSERDSLLDLPGSYIDTQNDIIYHPEYIIEEMPIKYFDDLGADQHWTDFISGTRMSFTNPWREYGHSVDILNLSYFPEIDQYEGTGADYYAPIINERFKPSNDSEKLPRFIFYNMKFNYDNTQNTFDGRPPYSYKVVFSRTAAYEAFEVLQQGSNLVCDGSATNTMLPFKVINVTTGRDVGLRHVDQGFKKQTDDNGPAGSPAGGCEEEGVDDFTGDCDCVWTQYEDVLFVADSVTTKFNTSVHPEVTYSLELGYNFPVYFTFLNVQEWNPNLSYNAGTDVIYESTRYEAIEDSTGIVIAGEVPSTAVDSKWLAKYPWTEFDSVDEISILIEPWTWFADGDNWTADLSLLAQDVGVGQAELEKVSVSPNPYFVQSGYNEGPGEHKMMFSNLPTECEINIYTVTGRRIKTIQHTADLYEGIAFWDLKNGSGNLVGPGLYIYTVEDIEYMYKHIGKFAIVR